MRFNWISLLPILLVLVRENVAEKKIELEDIEQDNLKSEREKAQREEVDSGQNQQQYAGTHQYAVEEEQPSGYYPSGEDQQVTYQQSNSIDDHANQQGYPVEMRVVYVPQYYYPTAGDQGYYYNNQQQQQQQQPQQYSGIKYVQEDQQEQKEVEQPQVQYFQPSAYDNYAQYENNQINQNADPHQNNYVQQYVYVNAVPQSDPTPYKYVQQTPVAPQYLPQYDHVKEITQSSPGDAGHIPRVIPQYEPQISKPIYSHIAGNLPDIYDPVSKLSVNHLKPQQYQDYSSGFYPIKRPKSLLDSYIPSSLQIAYHSRGLSKDLASTYDTILSKGIPKDLQGGFIPNQMFTDADGRVTYGHFKRSV